VVLKLYPPQPKAAQFAFFSSYGAKRFVENIVLIVVLWRKMVPKENILNSPSEQLEEMEVLHTEVSFKKLCWLKDKWEETLKRKILCYRRDTGRLLDQK
jgi:hypothetical protein